MTTIELPCTTTDCDYKTPALPYEFAFQQMKDHRADNHNTSNATTNTATPKPEKVGRPSFDLNQTSEKWSYFKSRWDTYKTATGLTGANIQVQLMETCSEPLRFSLFQSDPTINTKTEDIILSSMKRLSVKEENQLVSRMALQNFQQEPDEQIRNFLSRLQGQAELCKYTEKCATCDTETRFTQQMVRDNLVRGLYDQDIQREILGLEDQTKDLEQLVKLVEAKEAGRRTQASLRYGANAAAMSQHKANKRSDPPRPIKCTYCGETGHGKNDGPGRASMSIRQEKCSAFQHVCKYCNRKGHFDRLCRKKDSHTQKKDNLQKQGVLGQDAALVYEELCLTSVVSDQSTAPSDHPTVPSDDANMPSDSTVPHDSTVPSDHPMVPSDPPTVPSDHPKVPSDDSTVPSDVSTAPSNHSMVPPDHSMAPSDQSPVLSDQSTVPSNQSMVPSNQATLPAYQETNNLALISLNRRPGQSITIDTQQYDRIRGWIAKIKTDHPTIKLNVTINPDDYAHFGYNLTYPPKLSSTNAVTDTGCQSTIGGLLIMHLLGFNESDLIPTEIRMRAIDKNPIGILGAILIRLSGQGPDGQTLETAQVCYISNQVQQLYLSEHACKQLGIIPESFPSIGSAMNHHTADAHATENTESSVVTPCGCPARALPPPMPTTLPYPPTEKNRDTLKHWILDRYASSTFNVCPHQPLPLMEGPPVSLMIEDGAKPVVHHTPIPVPLHWQEEVYAGLMRDVALGVIEPVPIGTPVTWCHQMVIARKKDGSPRRVVDFQPLNKYCIRETHHTMSPFHQVTLIPPNSKKSVCDAWNGYHSVPIQEKDRHYTTFITPWGRFRYCTLPQGFASAGDAYTRRFDEIVSDFPDKTKCIDDACMWKLDIAKSFFQCCQWLDICGRHGITQNPDKFQFALDTVDFAGFIVSDTGIGPGETFIRAIRDLPTPKTTTDIRSFFGLVNQVNYCLSSSETMLPFRELLAPSTKFYWNDTLDNLFSNAKQSIIAMITNGVRIFEKSRRTCLSTDWSKQGIGFSLGQKHCDCDSEEPFCCPNSWQLTFASNRFTHNAESRYAPIEGEALAVAWALDKARHFVLGCKDLIVATDHKPLLKVLGDRHLKDIKNPRLFNLKEKTLPFHFKLVHVPGKRHFTADVISRYPSGNHNPDRLYLQDDIDTSASATEVTDGLMLSAATAMFEEEYNDSAVTSASFEENLNRDAMATLSSLDVVSWQDVLESTTNDPVMQMLSNIILD